MLCLLAATASAFADEPDGPEDVHAPQLQAPIAPVYAPAAPALVGDPRREIDELERSGRRLRAGGAVMIALGAALEVAGQIMVLHSQLAESQVCTRNLQGATSCSSDLDVGELVAGIVAGLAGGGLLGGGVPVFGAGSARLRRAAVLRARMGLSLDGGGAGLRLSAAF
jgi:hypothetical protein